MAVATLAGGASLAAAYVPALLAPYFATTQGYLTNRMGTLGTFNLPFFVEMGTFYNSTYFFAGLIILVTLGTVMGWRRARLPVVVLTLWWLPFFILYIFVVRFPGTHFYLLMESWSLLGALALAGILEAAWARPPLVRWGVAGVVASWLLLSSGYLYLLFFRQNPEYLINLPASACPSTGRRSPRLRSRASASPSAKVGRRWGCWASGAICKERTPTTTTRGRCDVGI